MLKYCIQAFCLIYTSLTLVCDDLVKCSNPVITRWSVCKGSSVDDCVHTGNSVSCPIIAGNSAPCNPDWLHSSCSCNDIGSKSLITGADRCTCQLDIDNIGLVVGAVVGATICVGAILSAAAAFIYRSKYKKMKHDAQDARLEMKVLSQALENRVVEEQEDIVGHDNIYHDVDSKV